MCRGSQYALWVKIFALFHGETPPARDGSAGGRGLSESSGGLRACRVDHAESGFVGTACEATIQPFIFPNREFERC